MAFDSTKFLRVYDDFFGLTLRTVRPRDDGL
jgi:hypothetical protein